MWVFTKPRGEHDRRSLLNLALCSRINISQLGDRWFLEVILGNDTFPIAALNSLEEADNLLHQIFDHMRTDEKAMDMAAAEEKPREVHEDSREPKETNNKAPAPV